MKKSLQKTLWVSIPSKRYPIHCHTDSAWSSLAALSSKYQDSKLFIITDNHLARIYQRELTQLTKKGFILLTFPAGEASKSHKVKCSLEHKLFSAQCSRKDIIVTLGGGVVSDLGGFVAATFMRGIRYISVPTTLMAMTDAAIGGKTGIDTPFGKNLIGAFHHPEAIFIHLPFLKTLPHDEYLSGLAEITKHAFIKSPMLYKMLTKHSQTLKTYPKNPTPDSIALFSKLLTESILTKIRVVTHDPGETGYRRILNFGHTIAHGIEKLSKYTVKHGHAVAMGMALEAWLSYQLGMLSYDHFEKITDLLAVIGLPITLPPKIKVQPLYNACTSDKKNEGKIVRFVPLKKIGAVFPAKGAFVMPLEYNFFKKVFKEFQKLNR